MSLENHTEGVWCLWHEYSIYRNRAFYKLVPLHSVSPEMPENEATFAITAGGIGDAKE